MKYLSISRKKHNDYESKVNTPKYTRTIKEEIRQVDALFIQLDVIYLLHT
jgi:hypothetical protein